MLLKLICGHILLYLLITVRLRMDFYTYKYACTQSHVGWDFICIIVYGIHVGFYLKRKKLFIEYQTICGHSYLHNFLIHY